MSFGTRKLETITNVKEFNKKKILRGVIVLNQGLSVSVHCKCYCYAEVYVSCIIRIKDKDKDLFIGLQEFIVGYSKASEQPQSSARPICHSHAMTRTGREPATIRIAAYIRARRSTHCAMDR